VLSKQPEITRLKAEDAGSVSALIRRAQHAAAHIDATQEAISAARLIELNDLGLVLVAHEQGRIVGTGTLLGEWIYNVFVEPHLWQHGIGRYIMDSLVQCAWRNHAVRIGLFSNLAATGFYERCGFWPHAEKVIYRQRVVEMYKDAP